MLRSVLAIAIALSIAGCGADEVEERLVGTWQSVLMGPQGTWTLTFEPEAGGSYRTCYSGVFAPAEEEGSIEARDGKWRLEKDAGGEDDGTYAFVTPDVVVFTGRSGVLTWTRVGGSSLTGSAPVPGAMPAMTGGQGARLGIAPDKIEWPARGVPALARKAAEHARKWKDDAVLLSIEAQLNQGTQAQYIPTDLGSVSLAFRFFSPSASRGMTITPGAPGNEMYEMGFVDWGDEKPLPDDFMDLADAVARATERGMRAPTAERAELRDWARSSVGGVGAKGFAWMVYPPVQFREKPFAIPIAGAEEVKLREIDACALVTAGEAAEALGEAVNASAESTRPNVWDCRYSAKSNRQRSVSINVDEDPHRDGPGFLRNLAKNGRPKVDGLGGDAYIFDSPAGFVELNVLSGKTLLSMGMNDPSSSARAEAIKKMGRLAVERLQSGAVVRLKPGPLEAVVGEWQAEHEDGRLGLSVAKDLSLELTVRADDGSQAQGKGYVDLTSDGRALFHLPDGVGRAAGLRFENDATVEHGGGAERFVMRLSDGTRIAWSRPGAASAALPSAAGGAAASSREPSAPSSEEGAAPSGERSDLERKTVEAGRKAADWSGRAASKVGGFFKGLVGKDGEKKAE